jgi:phytoene dehydrogenase-like protein
LEAKAEVIIVGGGLAGLCCARKLHQEGISFLLLEASDGLGGRVRTDTVEGFLLDRGFQVLLAAYPEARRTLDYQALDLHSFYPGAMVRFGGKFHRVADPWRHPGEALKGMFSPVGTFTDKLKVGKLRRQVLQGSVEEIFQRRETTALEALQGRGFSAGMIDRFFRPFLGGVFFDRELRVSSRMFEFGFRMFSSGKTALPGQGMGAIPAQIASSLPAGALQLNTRVDSLQDRSVILSTGEKMTGGAVVLATEGPETARLLGEEKRQGSRSTTCVYFAAAEPVLDEPLLVLNGEGQGLVNSLAIPSRVAPAYAPPGGQSLIAATVIGLPTLQDDQLTEAVRSQLTEWFGPKVSAWRHLRTYWIRHALPLQIPPLPDPAAPVHPVRPGLYVCGEYANPASLQWAMASGRKAAEAVIGALK